jgi:NAD(P)-dependent dehydrogenase (short-subunit alcohol dehydrogenase family)
MSLQGRVALITGASRGIGLEIARLLAREGMVVGMNAHSERVIQEADTLADEGLSVQAYLADVSQKQAVVDMFAQVEDELGPLWLLVNNAGILRTGPTSEMSEEAWDVTYNVNAKGVFLCSQAAIQKMIPRKAGRIVNISSIAGRIVRIKQIGYSSAKAAAIHFSRCLAVEVAPHGITVNCICPGMTWTEMLANSAVDRGLDLEAMVALIPAGHMAQPADHAHLVAYFASEEAGHVTGQVISVDGGQDQYMPLTAQRI